MWQNEMGNAIQNSIFRVMKETKDNVQGRQYPTAPCPRCGGLMDLSPMQDHRMGIFLCRRCRYKAMTRLN